MVAVCKHRSKTLLECTVYAFILACGFILNLYICVPKTVRKLPRSDTRQIKWRIFSVIVTVLCSLLTYPLLFCEETVVHSGNIKNVSEAVWKILGFRFDISSLAPLCHTALLYFGPTMATLLQHRQQYSRYLHDDRPPPFPTFYRYILSRLEHMIKVTLYENPWTAARNLLIAPLAEEVVFRACIIPPFLNCDEQLSPTLICWITPLFFGIAHLHHAFQKLQEGLPMKTVFLMSAFQVTYTTLFGAYASYCFIKTASTPGVVLLHSFCNFMGLPNVTLLFDPRAGNSTRSGVDGHNDEMKLARNLSRVAYAVGIVAFVIGFSSWGLFPKNGAMLKLL
uniref:intramembrane prenyl-peptidase Rce1 n=1 Tax=Chaetoceros debilis TaxID=122233 RepID=A0A7S3PXG9_9STRA